MSANASDQGSEFRQVGHFVRYNVLPGPEQAGVSAIIITTLNITVKNSPALLY
jgi:hypothetical protein